VHYLVQPGQSFGIIEDNLTQLLAINLVAVLENPLAKSIYHRLPGHRVRLESLVSNLVGTQSHRTKLSQKIADSAFAAAYASGKAYNYHSRLSYLFSQQRLEISS